MNRLNTRGRRRIYNAYCITMGKRRIPNPAEENKYQQGTRGYAGIHVTRKLFEATAFRATVSKKQKSF